MVSRTIADSRSNNLSASGQSPLLEKREKGRTLGCFVSTLKDTRAYTSSLKWPIRHLVETSPDCVFPTIQSCP